MYLKEQFKCRYRGHPVIHLEQCIRPEHTTLSLYSSDSFHATQHKHHGNEKTKAIKMQRNDYRRTSTARGEMAISSGSPSSPVLGFCVTLVAGRKGEDENSAHRWRRERGAWGRGAEPLISGVLATLAVRQERNWPSGNAERQAGREVENRRQAGACDSRLAAVDDNRDRGIV
jgi:hypothetical protein